MIRGNAEAGIFGYMMEDKGIWGSFFLPGGNIWK